MNINESTSFTDNVITAIINRVNEHNSPHWIEWVCNDTVKHDILHRVNILQNGQLDFTVPRMVNIEGTDVTFSTDEIALLHTYYYLEMHHYSFRRCLAEIGAELIPTLQSNPMVIDFGCGPSTAGLTLADWYHRNNNATPLMVNYWGIDTSLSMLNLGKAFMTGVYFIDNRSTLNYRTDFRDVELSKPRPQSSLILLFSFIMAHNIPVGEIADWIITKLVPACNQLIIINQNSPLSGKNNNWATLKKLLYKETLQTTITHDTTKEMRYQYNPHRQIPWKNRNTPATFDVIFNYICFNKVSTDDAATATV